MNLIANASDAMPHGGTISITSSRYEVLDDGRSLDIYVPNGEYVAIRVADTGVGMPIGIALAAPDPFFTTKEPERGTGLGLAIVMGAMKSAGGALRIESAVDAGTVVTMLIPRWQEPE